MFVCLKFIRDTAGQERYGAIAPMFFRGASIITLVYDISQRHTFEYIQINFLQAPRITASNAILVIIGNKSDLCHNRKVTSEEGLELAEKYGALFFEMTAKNYDAVLNMYIVASTAARVKELTGDVTIHRGSLPTRTCNMRTVMLKILNRDQLCDISIQFL
jgi:GTPase SAR1 family protein